MELIQHHCKNCGGTLFPVSEGKLKCQNCGSTFDTVSAEKHTKQMQELFDDAKQETINNLRRNLYDATHAEFVSSTEVHNICMSLKQYLPDDFQAGFYDVATGSNVRQLTAAIRKIDVEKHYDDLEGILQYLIRSLQTEYLLELNNLVERAYKQRDLEKFEQYSTAISEEADKVLLGVYETKMPREVFVAYSSKDMDKVSELVSTLEGQGLKCFVAARNLRHGKGAVENYNRALEEAMEHCKSFVFVSSRNSRSISCDALEIEIPFIQKTDLRNAPAEYRNNYTSIPHRYKKPRVEYRIEESDGFNAADTITNEFFDGYERVYSPREVAKRVMQQLIETPHDDPTPKSSAEDTKKKFCAKCGHENVLDTKFCAQCGHNEFLNSVADFIRVSNEKQAELQRQKEKELREAARQAQEAKQEAERQKEAAQRAEEKAKRKSRDTSSYIDPSVYTPESDKNPWVAIFLCYFLGIFGAHRFYAGKKGSGIFYLCTCGGFGIGWLVDFICILTGRFKDEYDMKLGFGKGRRGKSSAGRIIGIVVAVYAIIMAIIMAVAIIVTIVEDSKDELDPVGSSDIGDTVTVTGYDNLTFTMNAGGYAVTVEEGKASNLVGELVIPSDVNGTAVVSIPENAFLNCNKLTSVTVPDSVTTIGDSAFNGCASLRSITLPFVGNSDTSTDADALFGSIFGTTQYNGGIATRQYYSGSWSNTYYIPTQLTTVTVTNATQLSINAFQNCTTIKKLELNEGIISLGEGCFQGCTSLTALALPESITLIPKSMAAGCSALSKITYAEEAVTSIGEGAFSGCSALEKLNSDEAGRFTFHETVGFIGGSALNGCAKLKTLDIPFIGQTRTAKDANGMFGYIFGTTQYGNGIAVTQHYSGTWSNTYYLPTLLKTVNVTDATQISYHAFEGCSSLTAINLNDGITSVGEYAFMNCSSITTVNLPDIAIISNGMMSGCSALKSFVIGEGVTQIGSAAFSGCSALSALLPVQSLQEIDSSMLDLSELDGVFYIPETVTNIGGGAFNGCARVKTLVLPFVGLTATSEGANGMFGSIFGTEAYTTGTAVRQYYSGTWSNTYYIPTLLRSVIVTNASQLVSHAFQNCTMLTEIQINESTQSNVATDAFDNCVAPIYY